MQLEKSGEKQTPVVLHSDLGVFHPGHAEMRGGRGKSLLKRALGRPPNPPPPQKDCAEFYKPFVALVSLCLIIFNSVNSTGKDKLERSSTLV